MNTIKILWSVCVLTLALGPALISTVRADEPAGASKSVYAPTLKGTVAILAPEGRLLGTGWVVDRSRRLVITNHHVADKLAHVKVLFPMYRENRPVGEPAAYDEPGGPSMRVRGRVVDTDPKRDLTLIHLDFLPTGVTELKLASDSCEPGDRIHSIGNPSGVTNALWVYSSGTVRAVSRTSYTIQDNQKIEARVVQTQAPLNPGDSGGPVVNDRGELVAVTSSSNPNGSLVSACIDITEVRVFLKGAEKWLAARTAEELRKRGKYHEENQHFALAIEDFTAAIRLDPTDGSSYSDRGFAQVMLRQYDKAIADFVIALRLNPKDTRALRERGIAFFSKGDIEQSLADLTDALNLEAKSALALRFRGLCYQAQGKTDEALKDFEEAIRMEPKHGGGYSLRGELAFNKGDLAAAIQDYDQAIQLGSTQAYVKRANAYAKKKDLDRALKDYDLALKMTPYDPAADAIALCGRGDVYRRKLRLNEAIRDYTGAMTLNPGHAPAYLGRGMTLALQKRHDDAIVDFTRVIEFEQNDRAYAERCRSFLSKARLDDALQDAQEAIRLTPKDANAYNLLGICYFRKGDHEQAIYNYDLAIKINSKNVVFLSNRGLAYLRKGSYDRAIDDLNAALKMKPTHAPALFARGQAYEKMGDQEKARLDFEAARKLDPTLK